MVLQVLIVEGSEEDALYEVRELQTVGGELQWERVWTAEAMKVALASRQWDLLLVGDAQSGFGGIAALELASREAPDVPSIVVSGKTDRQSAAEFLRSGARDCVSKDYLPRLGPAAAGVLSQAVLGQDRTARDHVLVQEGLEVMGLGMAFMDARHGIAWVNAALERYLGIRREELLGRDGIELIESRIKHCFADPEAYVAHVLPAYLRNDYALSFDCLITSGKGRRERWVNHQSRPIKSGPWAGGHIVCYYDISEQKRLEHEQTHLSSFVHVAPFPILEISHEGWVTVANPNAVRSFPGIESAGPAHPIVQAALFAAKKLAQTGLPSFVQEYTLDEFTYELRIWLSRSEGFLQLYALDITERKGAEALLQERDRRYRNIFEAVPVSIWEENWEKVIADVQELKSHGVVDFHRYFADHPEFVTRALRTIKIMDVNGKTCAMFEASSKEQLLQSLETVFATDDTLPGFVSELEALAAGRLEFETEMKLRTAQGRLIHTLLTMTFPARSRPMDRVLVSLMDITERKQTEATQQRLAAMVESSLDPMISLTSEGIITTWNQAAARLFGYTAGEAIGQPIQLVGNSPDDWARLLAEIRQGPVPEREAVRVAKDGRHLDVSITAFPIKDAQGRSHGIAMTLHDITNRKRAEAQAHRIEHLSLLGQTLGGIAHEIKNPLFVISGHMQMMRDRLAAGEYRELQKDVDRIEEATQRIVRTVQRFLSLARPAAPEVKRVLVQKVLDRTLDFLSHELLVNQIALETNISPHLPAIQGDLRLLHDAFLNLFVNAIQAMHGAHGKGRLLVTAMLDQTPADSTAQPGSPAATSDQTPDRWIEVRVQDDGPGILPEHRSRLFDPFFSTKPEDQGTGLGLWTARSNVVTLGGTVTCETEPGQGATFIVRLPASEASTIQRN